MPDVEIVQELDGEGCPITLGRLLGSWTAPWPHLMQQTIRAQQFTFHHSDILLIGYSKSGTHWMWEMLHMLLKGKPEYSRVPKERLMLSFSTQEFFDRLLPPRVFNTHAPFAGLPLTIRKAENRCKMIYLLRNPKDVAVSFYHHLRSQIDFQYEGTFHGFLELFLDGRVPGGSWFDYVLHWESVIKENSRLPVLVLHYEDIKEDTVSVLRQVSEFLRVKDDASLLEEIARQCGFQRMKIIADLQWKNAGPEHVNLSKTGKNFIYRKGQVGDWKNWFSEKDYYLFSKYTQSKMKNSSLKFRYSLDSKTSDENKFIDTNS